MRNVGDLLRRPGLAPTYADWKEDRQHWERERSQFHAKDRSQSIIIAEIQVPYHPPASDIILLAEVLMLLRERLWICVRSWRNTPPARKMWEVS